ncbi:LysR family transcriptional regulator [Variovorax sp. WS11]|uniref:LysR family transcriptional regulator n=1 Tax=Variovorax sp. WS11 TaxID=1105204 RepID=UPI000D0E2A2C|nr:LysR family transcriptional regulator [Variovorax sp. WS11]NDZ14971.1 LysR family transcriptional regulator [Variovorax sp. WS11]PSL83078.1 LysR family transcriptional regulator [Variovorax sp. WS11]
MQTFDLEQLRTFVAVVEAGSLTAAAPQVFLSQSAVSEQMRKLEERAGQSLLTRSKAGVAPTVAGTRLLGHAQRLLALADEALRDLRGDTLQGELRLAVTDYFRPGELARLLGRLGERYPQVRLHVSVMKSGAIEAGYAQGQFDVGLSMRITGQGDSASSKAPALRRESLAWMGATGLRPVRGEPLRLLVLPDTCSLHQFTVKLLKQRRVPFTVAHVASGVAGLQSALAAGLGVACLNESSLCEGVARLALPHGLPALPRVAFQFLPPRRGESAFVTRARELLASQLV